MKNTKWLAGLMGVFMLSMVPFPVQAKGTDTREKTTTYQTKDRDERRTFPEEETFDGERYERKDVKYEVVKEEPEKEKKTVEYTMKSDPVIKGGGYQFPQEQTIDGILYRLQGVKEEEGEPYRQSVYAYREYGYGVNYPSVPQTREVSAKNEKTGEEETVVCRLSSVDPMGHAWVDSSIDITFQGYDRNAIEWQGLVFPNDRGAGAPLQGYEEQLLASVGLDGTNGKVKNTYYTSDIYTNADGEACRDAKADIQKLVPVYRAQYHGEITTPQVVKTALYRGEQEVDSQTDINYTVKATAVYQKAGSRLPYILAGAGILVGVALIIAILMIFAKKGKEKGKHAAT